MGAWEATPNKFPRELGSRLIEAAKQCDLTLVGYPFKGETGAAENGHNEVVKLLLGATPLHLALQGHGREVVDLLLEKITAGVIVSQDKLGCIRLFVWAIEKLLMPQS